MSDFVIDAGPSGGSGPGVYLRWRSKESNDGQFRGRSWTVRGEDMPEKEFTAIQKTGIPFDVLNAKTGWMFSTGMTGQAPERRWNESLAKFAKRPGDDWKKAFEVYVLVSKEQVAVWDADQLGAYQAFITLLQSIDWKKVQGGFVPLVKQTEVKTEKLKNGVSNAPVLEVVKYIKRPEIFDQTDDEEEEVVVDEPVEEADDEIDTGDWE